MYLIYLVSGALICAIFVYMGATGGIIFDFDNVQENRPLGARQYHK